MMMNVATAPGGTLPNHFAPPARTPSTRRQSQIYHHPTLHMRTSSSSSPRHSAQEFVAYQPQHPPIQTAAPQYSPPTISQPTFQRSPSNRAITPQPLPPQFSQPQYPPSHAHTTQPQQRYPLQRQPTAGSSSSLNAPNAMVQYIQPGPPALAGHRRQTASTSTSNSSIVRIPSGHSGKYHPSPPAVQLRSTIPVADTYVARLRRAKATVWSARGQRGEDLDRSNSKEDKYNKKYSKRPHNSKSTKLITGGPSAYSYEGGQYLHAHPRQLQPRLSANEVEDTDEIDPFISGPNFFDTTTTAAASTKESVKTKTTTSSTSPSASSRNLLALTSTLDTPIRDDKSSLSVEDGRGSPDQMQSYFKPARRESRRVSRIAGDDDGVKERQVGGERRLFVVNASPETSDDEA